MYDGKRVTLIIAAAGSGRRFGGDIPKQYLKIDGVSVLRRSVDAFRGIADETVVVTDDISRCEAELNGLDATVVKGGERRQDSVYEGLKASTGDIVLIHDAARPFVKREVILRVLEGTRKFGSCIPAVTPKDTIRTLEGTLDRNSLYSVQTPQGFERIMLTRAYEMAIADGVTATDDAGIAERAGIRVNITEGDYENIKITTGEDMPKTIRIGTGYDVHQLVEGRDLILGGVKIPHEKGLLGHSDADVLIHAIMDALLGASAMGDIGKLFPDSSDEFKGISSLVLLERTASKIYDAGYSIGNIDATVVAQRPRLASHIDNMRGNIAKALNVDSSVIGIKATTTEKLGFEGRQEGISAQAVCILEK